ncbi:unnamed protein product, partial [Sphenostylis stenocarpa]
RADGRPFKADGCLEVVVGTRWSSTLSRWSSRGFRWGQMVVHPSQTVVHRRLLGADGRPPLFFWPINLGAPNGS